jgi:hypothetical protein
MNKSELVTIRSIREGDKNFIYSTWLLGVYYGDTIFKEMQKDAFMLAYHNLIDQIIKHDQIDIKIAALKEDTDTILGYSVGNKSGTTVHFVFVKTAWRKIGLAKMLLGDNIKVATTLTKLGLGIIRKKGIEFNPFVI